LLFGCDVATLLCMQYVSVRVHQKQIKCGIRLFLLVFVCVPAVSTATVHLQLSADDFGFPALRNLTSHVDFPSSVRYIYTSETAITDDTSESPGPFQQYTVLNIRNK
jgi:hypothetical protein